jgi:hypothetical protein
MKRHSMATFEKHIHNKIRGPNDLSPEFRQGPVRIDSQLFQRTGPSVLTMTEVFMHSDVDDVSHLLTDAQILDLVAHTSNVVASDLRFQYFGTDEFRRRLCRLDQHILDGMKITTIKMAYIVGAPRELFTDFCVHFLVAPDLAILYAGSGRLVAVPRCSLNSEMSGALVSLSEAGRTLASACSFQIPNKIN